MSILLSETAGYHVRQAQFRQQMDKFKGAQSKDLTFTQMSREKLVLLTQTFRQLNTQFSRRVSASSVSSPAIPAGGAGAANEISATNPPLSSNKVA